MELITREFIVQLLAENEKQNLVSRKTIREELDKHIEDSLKIAEYISFDGQALIDIGSGAGFPGMILAIHHPDCQVTLVESDRKKSDFLLRVGKALGLHNVEVVTERAEFLGQQPTHRERYTLCTSRAVAALNTLAELTLPLVGVGGKAIYWKGRNHLQEIEAARDAVLILGGEIETIHGYSLVQPRDRVIIVVRKVLPTPPKYPRRPGIPAKRPL